MCKGLTVNEKAHSEKVEWFDPSLGLALLRHCCIAAVSKHRGASCRVMEVLLFVKVTPLLMSATSCIPQTPWPFSRLMQDQQQAAGRHSRDSDSLIEAPRGLFLMGDTVMCKNVKGKEGRTKISDFALGSQRR